MCENLLIVVVYKKYDKYLIEERKMMIITRLRNQGVISIDTCHMKTNCQDTFTEVFI